MSRPAWRLRPARGPWGLAGAVALVALVEAWVGAHWRDFTNVWVGEYAFARRAAAEAPRFDLLCVGDSLVKHGVAPPVLRDRLGRRTLNLANEGSTPPLTYALLRRALASGARPAAVLLDFKPTQLQVDPRVATLATAEALGPVEALDLCWVLQDPSYLATLWAFQALPSLRGRDEVRRRVVECLKGVGSPNAPAHLAAERNRRVNAGAELYPRNPGAAAVAEHPDEVAFRTLGAWTFHPVNALYVDRCLKLTARHGVPVYWLLPPVTPRVQERRDRLGHDEAFDRMLTKALRHYPHVTVIDGRRAGFPATEFVDGSHLDAQGACRYTDDLAGVLQSLTAHPPADRWVKMPPYRDRPVAAAVEDLAASRAAVTTEAQTALAPAAPARR